MVHLAIKFLLYDKMRFLTTVSGVAFAVMLVIVQVGIFLGMLESASITIERLDADLWVTARNTPNIDFANTFPESYVHRVRSVPGVLRADNLIVWFVTVALPSGAKEATIVYALEDFPRWNFPWNVVVGNPLDLRRGRFVLLDESAVGRFGPFAVGDHREFMGLRLKIIGRTREARSFTTNPLAFLDYRVAQAMAPLELRQRTTYILVKLAPGADLGGGAGGHPPEAPVQRRADQAGVGRAVPQLLGREHRAGPEHVHDRLPGLPGRRGGGRADVVHGDHRAFPRVRDDQGHRGLQRRHLSDHRRAGDRSPPWRASSRGRRWPTPSGR